MTPDHLRPQGSRPAVGSAEPESSPRADKPRTADVLAAGAMTALLSGDVRLAVRATRLLKDDSEPGSPTSPARPSRLRRVWRRRDLSGVN
jgi:hypothetical protein